MEHTVVVAQEVYAKLKLVEYVRFMKNVYIVTKKNMDVQQCIKIIVHVIGVA